MRKAALSILCMLAVSAHADSGLYVGLGVGYSFPENLSGIEELTHTAKNEDGNTNEGSKGQSVHGGWEASNFSYVQTEKDLGSVARGLFVGYEKDWYAIELDYSKVISADFKLHFDAQLESSIAGAAKKRWLGESYTGADVDVERLSLSFLAISALNNSYDLYGRIGYAGSTIDYTALRWGPALVDDSKYVLENDSSTGLLLGVGLRWSEDNTSLRLEAQYDDSLQGMAGVVGSYVYRF